MTTEITELVEGLDFNLTEIMKKRIILKMEELIKPQYDKILEDVAEELLMSLKGNISHMYSLYDDQHVFWLSFKDKENRIM